MNDRLNSGSGAPSFRGRMVSGCLTLIALTACSLYVLGFGSYLARPYLLTRAEALTTVIPRSTLPIIATPTQQPMPTPFIVPGRTLVATPTQARIPTRQFFPTNTPFFIQAPTSAAQFISPQTTVETPLPTEPPSATLPPTATFEVQPTTMPTATPPQPTRTRRPTRTLAPPTATSVPPTIPPTPKPARTRKATKTPGA